MKELIAKRINIVDPSLRLEEVFERAETIEQLCLISGGHVRNLMLLMKTAIQRTDKSPIPDKAIHRAIAELRGTYRNAIYDYEWSMLAKVSRSKQTPNQDEYCKLLFNRCILEYRYIDPQGEIKTWHDIHPLIHDIEEF